MNTHLSVAVIIPAYNSFSTIEHSLDTLSKQEYPVHQIIVVDSSPNDQVEGIVTGKFPEVAFFHSKKRLLPHAARNAGAQKTSSDLLVFTDPDIYARPNWITNLVEAYRQHGGVIIGSVTNHSNSWLEWGIHFGKFDPFLPGAGIRPLGFCATANMLCSRSDFERMGGFEGDEMLGDLLISWKFVENHIPIIFAPSALVEHHHTQSYPVFLHERFLRGMDFGRLRHDQFHWTKLRTIWHLLITISGARLLGLMVREGKNSLKAKLFFKFLLTFPVSFTGQAFWLFGETSAFVRVLTR